jgi:hypothetical protein
LGLSKGPAWNAWPTTFSSSAGSCSDLFSTLYSAHVKQNNFRFVSYSYYPLYPPTRGVNICYEHIDQLTMPCTPDILICPSKLRAFIKVFSPLYLEVTTNQITHGLNRMQKFHSGLLVNPGFLSKASDGACDF